MKRLIHSRIIAVLIIAAFFFSAFSTTVYAEPEDNVTEMSAQGEIISDVNVRKGPGTDYDKIGTVREGNTVTITGKTHDGWYRIEYEGEQGFIYGQYVSVLSTEQEGSAPEVSASEETVPEETDINEPAEEEEDSDSGFPMGILKLAAVIVIIVVIIIMIFLTIKSLRQAEDEEDVEDEEDEDEDEYDEDDEYDDEDEYDEDEEDEYDEDEEEDRDDETGDREEDGADTQNQSALKPEQTIIIREEDYQLHIDPKYFEDEPVAQPDYVTGYLKKKQEEEAEDKEEHSGELQKAMDKLQELQEEIEKLKKKQ